MDITGDAARVAAVYDEFGRRWAHGTSPLYEDWTTAIAADPELTSLIAALPRAKQQPNLVLAAARWSGVPLRPFTEIRAAIIERWPAIAATAMARATQTNEPNRCATWLPPLSRLSGPLALLEVGAAAGLCLYPDRYSVDYDIDGSIRRFDPADGASDVVLSCRLDDARDLPDRHPEVVWRRGIDLAPIDAGDPAAIAWLTALVWPGPDHDTRVARLRAAATLAAAAPVEIVAGDLLETLTDAAASAPVEATLVVFHSAVLLYLDPAARDRFTTLVSTLGAVTGRRVVWLSNETAGTLPGIDARLPRGLASPGRFVQSLDGRPIALAGQHGMTYETLPFGTAAV